MKSSTLIGCAYGLVIVVLICKSVGAVPKQYDASVDKWVDETDIICDKFKLLEMKAQTLIPITIGDVEEPLRMKRKQQRLIELKGLEILEIWEASDSQLVMETR